MAATTAATAPLSGRLVAAGRGRWALRFAAGTAIAAGAAVLVTLTAATPVAELAVVYVVFGVGFGFVEPAPSPTPPCQACARAGLTWRCWR